MNRLASTREEFRCPCYIGNMNGELRTLLRLPAASALALGLLLLRLAR
jgi:hypothetical protein